MNVQDSAWYDPEKAFEEWKSNLKHSWRSSKMSLKGFLENELRKALVATDPKTPNQLNTILYYNLIAEYAGKTLKDRKKLSELEKGLNGSV